MPTFGDSHDYNEDNKSSHISPHKDRMGATRMKEKGVTTQKPPLFIPPLLFPYVATSHTHTYTHTHLSSMQSSCIHPSDTRVGSLWADEATHH